MKHKKRSCWLVAVALCVDTLLCAQVLLIVEDRPRIDLTDQDWESDAKDVRPPINAIRLSSGIVVIADQQRGTIRFFDSTGVQRANYQLSGEGPGEFRRISWIGKCGSESVFVGDWVRRRIVILSGEGRFMSETPMIGGPERGLGPMTVACSREGMLAFQLFAREMSGGPLFQRGRTAVTILNPSGQRVATIADVPGRELVMIGGGGGPRPLGRETVLALSTDRLFLGTGDSAAIDVYTLDGRQMSTLLLQDSVRRPSVANHVAAVEAILNSIKRPTDTTIRQELLNLPMPSRLPPYQALLVDADNHLWVVLSAPGDRETRLRCLAESGRVVADLWIPFKLNVTDIGMGHVLGIRLDSTGAQHVALYDLRQSAPAK